MSCHISYHIISYIISYHIIYIISCHVISYHIISCHVIYLIISCHVIPYHVSYNVISYYIISYHIMYITMSYIILYYVMSCHIILKNWQTLSETCAVPENIQFSFSCSFFFPQFNLECMGPYRVYGALIGCLYFKILSWILFNSPKHVILLPKQNNSPIRYNIVHSLDFSTDELEIRYVIRFTQHQYGLVSLPNSFNPC
jgi:hypothetical protein